ncbi:FAD-dependent oxidoreductase [Streptomyces sp. NPDC101150]|uniref:FAD-dependent oxidoreductase n=1 Tax=Streptomyces sp. NPDC101150 TaxID=3366114 RepID=UPI003820C2AC
MTSETNACLSSPRWGKAVVIGGGYAGLVTARVLADHFAEVLVLEWDPVERDTGVHPHAPQGYHAHAMLAKGGETLERLFPGLRAELADLGAPVFDYGERISFLLPTGLAPRVTTGVRVQTFTRDELERRLRQKVLDLPAVTLLADTRCEGVTMSRPGHMDRVRYRTEGDERPTEVTADLVVDASGRSTAIDKWLTAARLPVPAKAAVKAKLTYTSMLFDRSEKDERDFDIAYQMTFAPVIDRGGVLLAVENKRWMCSLLGFEHMPPTDDEGFLDFARGLDNPHLAEQIAGQSRQGEVHHYTNPGSQWRLHHKSKRWPERLLSVGDSLCVFNPVYGQGLTVAALEADVLAGLLRRRRAGGAGLDGLSRAYHRAAARVIKVPWTLSTTSDLMWDPAHRPVSARAAHWFNQQVFALAIHDPSVWTRFARVANMTAPPSLLFRPSVLAKVLRRALTRRTARPVPPGHAPQADAELSAQEAT